MRAYYNSLIKLCRHELVAGLLQNVHSFTMSLEARTEVRQGTRVEDPHCRFGVVEGHRDQWKDTTLALHLVCGHNEWRVSFRQPDSSCL